MSNIFVPLKNKPKPKIISDESIAICPIPDDVEIIIPEHRLGVPSTAWEYKNAEGQLLMLLCRFIDDKGKKQDRPLTYCKYPGGKCKLAWKSLDTPRPLYGLDRLANKPDAIVIVCEGEKAADAATELFPEYVAVTSSHGSNSARTADWSLLEGRKVIIWPDSDEAGAKYAHAVEEILLEVGTKSVAIVSIPETFPEKWDLADSLPEGFGYTDLEHILNSAKPSLDSLEGLIEKCEQDQGYVHKTEVLDSLNKLRAKNKPEYMRLRSKLKSIKIGITELEKDLSKRSRSTGVGNDEPDHLEIAIKVLEILGHENVISDKSNIWRWEYTGVWKIMADRDLKREIQNLIHGDEEIQINVSKGIIESVADVLKNEIYAESHTWNIDQNSINVKNGELVFEDGQWNLQEHCRESYRTTQIPVNYDPEAHCPRFVQFLGEIFKGDVDGTDKVQAITEMMGYTLMNHSKRERFILLIGSGANGKSVIMEVVRSLLGSSNVVAVQPSQLSNRFQRAHLHMKMANLVTEIAEGGEIADAELKAITSGELMTAEHKNKDPFDFMPFSTCWFGSNHLPHTRDFSNALFRRALVIPFNRVFREGVDADPELKSKLMDELSGILNLCLEVYAKVIQNDRFTEPQSCIDVKEEWRMDANQVAQFVEQCCVIDPDSQITSRELYQQYKQWAENAGISRKLNQKNFTNRMQLLGAKTHKGTGGKRFIKGVRIVAYY